MHKSYTSFDNYLLNDSISLNESTYFDDNDELLTQNKVKTLKEYDEEIRELKNENFTLKLRIFSLQQENGNFISKDNLTENDADDLIDTNIQLQNEIDILKQDLFDKQVTIQRLIEQYNNLNINELNEEIDRLKIRGEELVSDLIKQKNENDLNCQIIEKLNENLLKMENSDEEFKDQAKNEPIQLLSKMALEIENFINEQQMAIPPENLNFLNDLKNKLKQKEERRSIDFTDEFTSSKDSRNSDELATKVADLDKELHNKDEIIKTQKAKIDGLLKLIQRKDQEIENLKAYNQSNLKLVENSLNNKSLGSKILVESLEKEIEIYKKLNTEKDINSSMKTILKEITELRNQLLRASVLNENTITNPLYQSFDAEQIKLPNENEKTLRTTVQFESPSDENFDDKSKPKKSIAILNPLADLKYQKHTRNDLVNLIDEMENENKTLKRQLDKRSPKITELHNEIENLRNRLAIAVNLNEYFKKQIELYHITHGNVDVLIEMAQELNFTKDELEAYKEKLSRAKEVSDALVRGQTSIGGQTTVTQSNNFTPTKQIKITVTTLEKTIEELKEKYRRLQNLFVDSYIRPKSNTNDYEKVIARLVKLKRSNSDSNLNEVKDDSKPDNLENQKEILQQLLNQYSEADAIPVSDLIHKLVTKSAISELPSKRSEATVKRLENEIKRLIQKNDDLEKQLEAIKEIELQKLNSSTSKINNLNQNLELFEVKLQDLRTKTNEIKVSLGNQATDTIIPINYESKESKSLDSKLNQTERILKDLQKENSELESSISDSLESQLSSDIENVKNDIALLFNEYQYLKQAIEDLESINIDCNEIRSRIESFKHYEEELCELRERKIEFKNRLLTAQFDKNNRTTDCFENELNSLKNEHATLENKINLQAHDYKNQIERLNIKVQALKEEINRNSKENKFLKEENTELHKKIEELYADKQKQLKKLTDQEVNSNDVHKKLNEQIIENEKLNKLLKQLQAQNQDNIIKNEQKFGDIEKLKAEIDELRKELLKNDLELKKLKLENNQLVAKEFEHKSALNESLSLIKQLEMDQVNSKNEKQEFVMKFEKSKQEIDGLKLDIYQRDNEINDKSEQIDELNKLLDELNDQLDSFKKKEDELNNGLSKSVKDNIELKQNNDLLKKTNQKLLHDLMEKHNTEDLLKNEVVSLKASHDHLIDNELARLIDQINNKDDEIQNLNMELKENTKEIDNLKNYIVKLEALEANLKEEIVLLCSKTENLAEANQAYMEKIEALNNTNKTQAEEIISLKNEIKKKEKDLTDSKSNGNQQVKDIMRLENSLQQKIDELSKTKSELLRAQEKLAKNEAQIEVLDCKNNSQDETITKLRKKIGEKNNETNDMNEKIREYIEEIKKLTYKIEKLKNENASLEQTRIETAKKIDKLKKEFDILKEKSTKNLAKIETLNQINKALEETIINLKDEISHKNMELNKATDSINKLESNETQLKTKLDTLAKKLDQKSQEHDMIKQELKNLEENIDKCNDEINKLNNKLDEANSKCKQRDELVSNLKQEIMKQSNEIEKLKENIDSKDHDLNQANKKLEQSETIQNELKLYSEEINQTCEDLKDNNQNLTFKLNAKEELVSQLKAEINQRQNEIDDLIDNENQLKQELGSVKKSQLDITKLKEDNIELIKKLSENQKNVFELQKELKENHIQLQAQITEYEKEVEKLRDENNKIKIEAEKSEDKIDEQNSFINRLTENNAYLYDKLFNFFDALKAIETNEPTLQTIFGLDLVNSFNKGEITKDLSNEVTHNLFTGLVGKYDEVNKLLKEKESKIQLASSDIDNLNKMLKLKEIEMDQLKALNSDSTTKFNYQTQTSLDDDNCLNCSSTGRKFTIQKAVYYCMYGVGTENDFKDLKGKLNDFKVFSDRVRNHLIVKPPVQLEYTLDRYFDMIDDCDALLKSFWLAKLPVKNESGNHVFCSSNENNRQLKAKIKKYKTEIQNLKEKIKSQNQDIKEALFRLSKTNKDKENTQELLIDGLQQNKDNNPVLENQLLETHSKIKKARDNIQSKLNETGIQLNEKIINSLN